MVEGNYRGKFAFEGWGVKQAQQEWGWQSLSAPLNCAQQ